ncbi:hypothetical protein CVT26_001090 [Gymnopilus dilepis]|uniref:Uncharacterized protein n=1 Tax=Gymnopilus dilepis TaxID=231916 RepID=A0A409X527_9AGAR|nr:hypothetical protein CVT26_001090 [Gymnopilus dilepis]
MINASIVCMESILSTEKKLLAVLVDVYESDGGMDIMDTNRPGSVSSNVATLYVPHVWEEKPSVPFIPN